MSAKDPNDLSDFTMVELFRLEHIAAHAANVGEDFVVVEEVDALPRRQVLVPPRRRFHVLVTELGAETQVRKHGIEHYLDLVRAKRIDLSGMLTHTFRLDAWREAFSILATQADSGAIKVAFDFR